MKEADPRSVEEKMKGWEQQYPRSSHEEESKLYEELKEKYSVNGIQKGSNSSIKYIDGAPSIKSLSDLEDSGNANDKEKFNGFSFKENKINIPEDEDNNLDWNIKEDKGFTPGERQDENVNPNGKVCSGDQNPLLMFGTPFWHLKRELPKGALNWALGMKEQHQNQITYNRGGYQSTCIIIETTPWKKYILDTLEFMPQFVLSGAWIDIRNKGDYHTAHYNSASDANVIWFLTDDDTLVLNDPLQLYRGAFYSQPALKNLMISAVKPKFNAGDFLVFPSDILHSNELVKVDNPVVTLTFSLRFTADT